MWRSHLITLALLQKNLSVESIAKKRALSVGTIVSHIEKLYSLKQLDEACIMHLKDAIEIQAVEEISAELAKSKDGKLKPLYEKFGGKYDYNCLKFVKLFVASSV